MINKDSLNYLLEIYDRNLYKKIAITDPAHLSLISKFGDLFDSNISEKDKKKEDDNTEEDGGNGKGAEIAHTLILDPSSEIFSPLVGVIGGGINTDGKYDFTLLSDPDLKIDVKCLYRRKDHFNRIYVSMFDRNKEGFTREDELGADVYSFFELIHVDGLMTYTFIGYMMKDEIMKNDNNVILNKKGTWSRFVYVDVVESNMQEALLKRRTTNLI